MASLFRDRVRPMATVDPRMHDAVIFALPQSDPVGELVRRLDDAGVASAFATQGLRETAQRLGARAERSVVVTNGADGVEAARTGGFSLVIGVGPADLLERGADAVVDDVAVVEVRTGDRRMSEIPDALESFS